MGYTNIDDRRAYHREYIKERRQWFKDHHMCTDCGKQDAYTLNGHTYCFECNEKRNKRKKSKYTSGSRKEYSKNKIQECHENGICITCKTRKVEEGKKQCSICLAKGRMRWHKKHDNIIPRNEREEFKLCYQCGKPLDGQLKTDGEPSKLCSHCYANCPKPPKTRVLYAPFCNTEKANANWQKLLEKREQLFADGTYDYIPIKYNWGLM